MKLATVWKQWVSEPVSFKYWNESRINKIQHFELTKYFIDNIHQETVLNVETTLTLYKNQ